MKRRLLTPYQRIMRASREGRGVRLSADEVSRMAGDTAIADLAEGDNAEMDGFGEPGIRDPEHPCDKFEPGDVDPGADCETDGHYLCLECVHSRPRWTAEVERREREVDRG